MENNFHLVIPNAVYAAVPNIEVTEEHGTTSRSTEVEWAEAQNRRDYAKGLLIDVVECTTAFTGLRPFYAHFPSLGSQPLLHLLLSRDRRSQLNQQLPLGKKQNTTTRPVTITGIHGPPGRAWIMQKPRSNCTNI